MVVSLELKRAFCAAPITALVVIGSNLYIASGNNLICADLLSGKIKYAVEVFINSSISVLCVSCKDREISACAGDNYVTFFYLNSNELDKLKCIGPLDDRVLDVKIHDSVAFVGFGHNFVDIFNLNDFSVAQRIFSGIPNCLLFCMSFAVVQENSNILLKIASGSALGKVYLWQKQFIQQNNQLHLRECDSSIIYLRGHEGVIFRIHWAVDASRLLTVSDDRTVRLWDALCGEQLWVGWGHICRVWDAIFLPSGATAYIATASEEGSLKLWSSSGTCLATLHGHAKHAWRLCATNPLICDATKVLIVSGGNDGAVKIWDVNRMIQCNNDIESSETPVGKRAISDVLDDLAPVSNNTCIVPTYKVEVEEGRSGGYRRLNGCSNVFVTPNCQFALTVLTDGCIWICELSTWSWNCITKLNLDVVLAHLIFDDSNCGLMSVAHPDGSATCLFLAGVNRLDIQLIWCHNWKAHELRCVNSFALCMPSTLNGERGLIFTSTVKGVLSVWSCGYDYQLNQATSSSFLTQLSTGNSQIVTFCSLTLAKYSIGNIFNVKVVTVGDCRGGLTLFGVIMDVNNSIELTKQLQFFAHAHGVDPVTCIKSISGDLTLENFASCGQNGTINIYSQRIYFSELSDTPNIEVQFVSQLPSFPVAFPDQLYFPIETNFNTDKVVGSMRLIVGGFVGNEYIVSEISSNNKYQFLKTEGGGWKRPHAVMVECRGDFLPKVTFVHCVPLKSGSKVVVSSNLTGSQAEMSVPTHVAMASSLGRVGYCSVAMKWKFPFPRIHFIAAGEDGIAKVYNYCVNEQHSLIQEIVLPGFIPIRSVCSCANESNDAGIVVLCGGKLSYSIWSYDCNDDMRNRRVVEYQADVLLNTIWNRATQDHRILSCSSQNLSLNSYLIATGDSRGTVTFILYNKNSINKSHGREAVHVLSEVSISEFPLLSLDLLKIQRAEDVWTFALATGDTSGDVRIHLVKYSFVNSIIDFAVIPIKSFESHSMGANCLKMQVVQEMFGYSVVAVSGGDDQRISVAGVQLDKNFTTIGSKISIFPERSSSAYKGISVICSSGGADSSIKIAGIGYDRRLQIHELKVTNEDVSLHNVVNMVSQIADIGGMCSCVSPWNDDEYYIGVVGEGFQIYKL